VDCGASGHGLSLVVGGGQRHSDADDKKVFQSTMSLRRANATFVGMTGLKLKLSGILKTMNIAYEVCLDSSCIALGLLIAMASFAILISIFSEGRNGDNQTEWDDDAFTVTTISLASEPKAVWVFKEDGRNMSKVNTVGGDNAAIVLKIFDRQSEQRKTRGIFVYSWSYAIPDIPEEHQAMSEHYYALYRNPEWRKSEDALIEDLQEECDKRKIPLYVNLSSNLYGKWKRLSPKICRRDEILRK